MCKTREIETGVIPVVYLNESHVSASLGHYRTALVDAELLYGSHRPGFVEVPLPKEIWPALPLIVLSHTDLA